MARILVVDDEPDVLKLLRLILERAGFEVTLAADGEQALRCLAEGRYDLVLCDVLMPGLDGYGVLAAIRGDSRSCDLPVLMLSAKVQPQDIQRALEAGADGYVIKPFQHKQLLADIRRCLAVRMMTL